jgi:hypothetical protein
MLRPPQASHATTDPHSPNSKSYASDFERRVDEVKVPKVYVVILLPVFPSSAAPGIHLRYDVINIKLGISLKIFM